MTEVAFRCKETLLTLPCLLKRTGTVLPLLRCNMWQEIWRVFLRLVTWVRWQGQLSNFQYKWDFCYLLPVPNPHKRQKRARMFLYSLLPSSPSCPHSRHPFLILKDKQLFFDIIMQSFKPTVPWVWLLETQKSLGDLYLTKTASRQIGHQANFRHSEVEMTRKYEILLWLWSSK